MTKPRSVNSTPDSLRPRFSVFHRPSRRHQHLLNGKVLGLPRGLYLERHAVGGHGRLLHLGSGANLDSPLLEAFRHGVTRFGILDREDPGQGFNEGDLGAEKLKTSANSLPTAPAPTMAMVAGAFSRNSALSELMTVLPLSSSPIWGIPLTREPLAITIPFVGLVNVGPYLDLAAWLQHSGSLDHGDLVLLHQELDALRILAPQPCATASSLPRNRSSLRRS